MIVHSRVRGILLLAINVTFVLLSYENGQKALTRPWTPLGAHPQTPDPRYRFALRVRHVPHFANLDPPVTITISFYINSA